MAEIVESYREWVPPINASRVVARLLAGIPQEYLTGLHSIVLTNSSGLNRGDRRRTTKARQRKVKLAACRGYYCQATRDNAATIVLYVDIIAREIPRFVKHIPFLMDLLVGSVLFHEIGHHIHITRQRDHAEKEDRADAWQTWLTDKYIITHYWYLKPILWLVAKTGRALGLGKIIRRLAPKPSKA